MCEYPMPTKISSKTSFMSIERMRARGPYLMELIVKQKLNTKICISTISKTILTSFTFTIASLEYCSKSLRETIKKLQEFVYISSNSFKMNWFQVLLSQYTEIILE